MADYKHIEEIREANGMSQVEFAQALGMSRRTYLDRLNGNSPNYLIKEIIEASKFNSGCVKVENGSEVYEVTIRKVSE